MNSRLHFLVSGIRKSTNIIQTSVLLCLMTILASPAVAQPVFPEAGIVFDDSSLPTVRIEIHPDTLALILADRFSDVEYRARFVFDSPAISMPDTVYDVGFRLRGNTSRLSEKPSFKVSFNTFEKGRKFYGLEKLNLNGEHNDPSIIRSKLNWDLFRTMEVPASRANHIRLYINGEYRGLYINVEHIDEVFIRSRFRNDEGNLYKCLYPADLAYLGDIPDAYKAMEGDRRTYDLKTNEDQDDYSGLQEFIAFLNTSSNSEFVNGIESYFNVDNFLKVMAIDIATGSWDDYWFLKNNYYLYENPETNRFEWIPYDYDNTFGIDFFGIDWGVRNVYSWGNDSEDRPLVRRLLEVTAYRDRFSYYLNEILTRHLDPATYFSRIDQLFEMIKPAAWDDGYRELDYGFTDDDFVTSFTQTTGHNHVPYGLKEFIETRRSSALQQLDLRNIAPLLRSSSFEPAAVVDGVPITVSLAIEDDSANLFVFLLYSIDSANPVSIEMKDDGIFPDLVAGDGTYTVEVPTNTVSTGIQYYVEVSDSDGGVSVWPSGAPASQVSVPKASAPPLVINEFMASNQTTIQDENGEWDDWVEIFNAGASPVNLSGIYFTDNLSNPDKFALPDATLQPGEFVIVWVDDDEEQGEWHTHFNLAKEGEQIGLFQDVGTGFIVVDSLSYGPQQTDISSGRFPDASAVWGPLACGPTPGWSNCVFVANEENTVPSSFGLSAAFPNPFQDYTSFYLSLDEPAEVWIEVYDVTGRMVSKESPGWLGAAKHKLEWSPRNSMFGVLGSGMYFVRPIIRSGSGSVTHGEAIKVLYRGPDRVR